MLARARPGALLVALVAIFLSLGMGSAAWADSGNGNGGSGSGGPPGQAASGTANAPGNSANAPGNSANAPGNSANAPGNSANAPGNSANAPGNSANAPGHAADGPGNSDHSQGNASTQGNPNKPQPISNADQNPGGANGKCPGGPYCSTRDGSPSLNGNGNGNAYGKPCAGCVGKADNKNPKGQYPNGKRDGNNGYECDGNNGIGKTNPAHTGCKAVPPAPKPKPPAPKPKPPVKGEQHFRPRPNAQVSQVLPNTGADANLGLYGVAGVGLIGLGCGLLGLRRRTTRR